MAAGTSVSILFALSLAQLPAQTLKDDKPTTGPTHHTIKHYRNGEEVGHVTNHYKDSTEPIPHKRELIIKEHGKHEYYAYDLNDEMKLYRKLPIIGGERQKLFSPQEAFEAIFKEFSSGIQYFDHEKMKSCIHEQDKIVESLQKQLFDSQRAKIRNENKERRSYKAGDIRKIEKR
jgi:hypothetical protein